jgi:hypothetical protein
MGSFGQRRVDRKRLLVSVSPALRVGPEVRVTELVQAFGERDAEHLRIGRHQPLGQIFSSG